MIEVTFESHICEKKIVISEIEITIKKLDEDLYEINIYNPKNKLYEDSGVYNIDPDCIDLNFRGTFWSNLLFLSDRGDGFFKNGDTFTLEQVNIIVQSIEYCIEKLEKETIEKIGNVTIKKKQINIDKFSITLEGLTPATDYPSVGDEISYGNNIKLYDDNTFAAWADGGVYFDISNYKNCRYAYPIKDCIVTEDEYAELKKIITISEQKLKKFKERKNKIKIGDKVKSIYTDFVFKVIYIHENDLFLQFDDSKGHTVKNINDVTKVIE